MNKFRGVTQKIYALKTLSLAQEYNFILTRSSQVSYFCQTIKQLYIFIASQEATKSQQELCNYKFMPTCLKFTHNWNRAVEKPGFSEEHLSMIYDTQ